VAGGQHHDFDSRTQFRVGSLGGIRPTQAHPAGDVEIEVTRTGVRFKNGIITTPPKSRFLLPGITRDLVLELAEEKGLPFREAEITEQALRTADEVWLTSSTKEIMPVTTLDHTQVGNGTPGPVYQQMSQLYADYKERIKQGLEQ
ncbi:MAG: hypothetical protein GY888_07365, partial [Planctomycetaceae bacterium]|nr:hypothetical protein [Planctomycetaceae bacterium]